MQGSEAIYTAPATPSDPTLYYYTVAIKDNTIYMGFRGATLDLKQRNLGYWLY